VLNHPYIPADSSSHNDILIWIRNEVELIEALKGFEHPLVSLDDAIKGNCFPVDFRVEPLTDHPILTVREKATSFHKLILDDHRIQLGRIRYEIEIAVQQTAPFDIAGRAAVRSEYHSSVRSILPPQRASESRAASASMPVPISFSNAEGFELLPERFDIDMRYERHAQHYDANTLYSPLRIPQMTKEPRTLRHELDDQKRRGEEWGKIATGKSSTVTDEKPRQGARIRREQRERQKSEEQPLDAAVFAKAVGINTPADTRNNIKQWQHELEFKPERALRVSEKGIVERKTQNTSLAITTTRPDIPLVPASIFSPHSGSGQALAGRLNGYFSGRDTALSSYSDSDIHEISVLLKHHAPKWCKTPRTYIILRTIDGLDLLDRCIDVGFSDYWLPVTERSLPEFLRPSVRTAFVEAQSFVLTKSMDLEKGAKGEHCYFRKGETLPLETKGILGSGGYGQVDRVLSLISFKEYARKRVLRSAAFQGRRKEDVTQFIAEIEILKRLKHHHVVEFVGSYTDAKYIGLIMTPIAEGDLISYLASATPEKYPELRTFFGCLANGLEFLHQHNVRHKDIKPGNILVNSGQVLFTDFGLSLDFTDATGSTTMSMVNGMTPRYCAPEVANFEPRNTMSDIWCLGVVFLEMLITLKGKTIEFMDDYFRQHGSRQAFVRFNIGVLPAFMAELAALGNQRDDKPIEWIESMLLEEQKLRPTASALVNQITTASDVEESFEFCGICCVGAEEEDFSDYASDSEG
jgi:hypothetical protein